MFFLSFFHFHHLCLSTRFFHSCFRFNSPKIKTSTTNKNIHTHKHTTHTPSCCLFVPGPKTKNQNKKNTGTTFGDALSSFYDCVNANNVWLIFTHIFHRIQLEIFLMDVYALNIFANYTNVIAPRMKSVYFGWKTYTNKYWNIRKKK